MPPHYSARSFFRQIPRDLLARYFESRGLSFKPDVATVADARPDPLYAAWLQFPEEQRNEMEIDFREIFRMSCRKGVQAILDATQARLGRYSRKCGCVHRVPVEDAGSLSPGNGDLAGSQGNTGEKPTGSMEAMRPAGGESARTWAIGRRQPMQPASGALPA